MMKNDEMKTAKRVRTVAVCGCLCLLALGAGVTYRAFDRSHRAEAEQSVVAVKSPTMEIAVLERNERSNDPGEAPAAEPKETKQEKVEMLTVRECSEVIKGLNEYTVRQLIARKEIPSVRTGQGKNGKILVPKAALLSYFNGTR